MRFKLCIGAIVVAATFVVGAATARPAAAAAVDDACSLLNRTEVSAAIHASVGAGSYVSPTFKKTCTWTVTSGTEYATLMLTDLNAYQAGKQILTNKIVITPVKGIGDDAYYLAVGNNVGLIVKKGNVAFKVAVYASAPLGKKEAMEKTLASQVVSKL